MEIVIVTGISGSGKSTALKVLEDMGYYAMDNLPPKLLADFIELSKGSKEPIEKVAIVTDIRGGSLFNSLVKQIEYLKGLDLECKLVFLDADDDTLVKRYKELRRPHPLSKDGNILLGIKKEREIFDSIRDHADIIIDTSNLKVWDFKKILRSYINGKESEEMVINITSFGYKHGILKDADIVMDVRFIPNPFYIKELKNKTGLDEDVREYILSFDISRKFLEEFKVLIFMVLPSFRKEGKQDLTIGIGCTGGKHRSVTISEELKKLLDDGNNIIHLSHRDKSLWT